MPSKILIADDNQNLLRTTSHLLSQAGYEIVQATTGAEALHQARREQPDLVLLDRILPDQDGMDICRQIKADPVTAACLVVLVSGLKISPQDQVESLAAGADSALTRPIDPGELLARVQAILRIREAEQAFHREHALLERVMETSPVGITLVDGRSGKITYANARAEAILGLSRDQLTDRTYNMPEWHITALDGGPFSEEELPFLRVMDSGEQVYDVRHAIEWPSGRRVLLSINGAPLSDSQGNITDVVFALEDITARVQEEQSQKEQNERELNLWHQLAKAGSMPITSRSMGMNSVREGAPQRFAHMVQRYGELLEKALEQRIYKVHHDVSGALQAIAQELGLLRAEARDVIDVHTAALTARSTHSHALKSRAYAEEGHLLALELMGYLTAFYRNQSLLRPISQAPSDNEPGSSKGEGDA